MFFFKSYVAFYGYVRRLGTDMIPEGVKKSYGGTGIKVPDVHAAYARFGARKQQGIQNGELMFYVGRLM